MNLTVTIDLDKACAECRKPGATGSGICLACANKVMSGRKMRSPQGRAVARRFAWTAQGNDKAETRRQTPPERNA